MLYFSLGSIVGSESNCDEFVQEYRSDNLVFKIGLPVFVRPTSWEVVATLDDVPGCGSGQLGLDCTVSLLGFTWPRPSSILYLDHLFYMTAMAFLFFDPTSLPLYSFRAAFLVGGMFRN